MSITYVFDALHTFREALAREVVGGAMHRATANGYSSALMSALESVASTPLTQLNEATIDTLFGSYGSTRCVARRNQLRAAWRLFRGWSGREYAFVPPPGKLLTQRWQRHTGDKAPVARPEDPIIASSEDVADLKAIVGRTRDLRLSDIAAMRWEGMGVSTAGDVKALTLRFSTGAELTLPDGVVPQAILRRWRRLKEPVVGPVFPRTPGSDDPMPLKALTLLAKGPARAVNVRG